MSHGASARFRIQGNTRREVPGRGELFQRLAVDQGGDFFIAGQFIGTGQRRPEIFRGAHVFPVGAQAQGHLVVAQVFLEQVHMHGAC